MTEFPPRPSEDASRRDPALGLLDRLVRDALDQGYYEAAERRKEAGVNESWAGWAGSRRRLVAACGLALIGLVISVAAVQQAEGAPQAAQRKQDLAAAIEDSSARVDDLERQASTQVAEVERLRESTLSSGVEGRVLQSEIDRLAPSVGTVEVSGPGVVVTVDDAPPDDEAIASGEPDLGRVLDRDLQTLVNGLWRAGAEAIDINGERLTSLTAIRGAGDAVLVNYRPLVRPYVVTAIGNSVTLAPNFSAGPGGVELETLRQTYGVRYELRAQDQLTVPGKPGLSLRYAEEDLR